MFKITEITENSLKVVDSDVFGSDFVIRKSEKNGIVIKVYSSNSLNRLMMLNIDDSVLALVFNEAQSLLKNGVIKIKASDNGALSFTQTITKEVITLHAFNATDYVISTSNDSPLSFEKVTDLRALMLDCAESFKLIGDALNRAYRGV